MRTDSSTKRLHQALALNATSNGGDASRVGKICNFYLAESVFSSFLYPDARRVAPIRGSVFLQRVSGNLKCPQNGLVLDAYFGEKLFMLWSFTRKHYYSTKFAVESGSASLRR